jgi:HAD superfamily hydrolase (TIGR01509 family)
VSQPRAILLDFGGTLDLPRHWLDRFLSHYRAAGLSIDRAELDPAFSHATAQGYRHSHDLQGLGLADLVAFLVHQQIEWLAENGRSEIWRSTSPATRKDISRAMGLRFFDESQAGLVETAAILTDLRQRGYKLGVVSNFYGNLERVLTEAGCASLFEIIVDSSAAGVFKPDAGIFMIALRALGVSAQDAVMVGDSLDKDCLPAHGLGMRTVWLCPRETEVQNEDPFAPNFVIRSLGELNEITW